MWQKYPRFKLQKLNVSPPEATKKPFLQKFETNSFLGRIFGRDRSKVESERRFFFLRSQFVLDRQLPTFGLTHFFTHLRRKKAFDATVA